MTNVPQRFRIEQALPRLSRRVSQAAISALERPGGSGGGAPGAEADPLAIHESLIDAKGDLIAGSAADAAGRLAVGSNGQVLTADSAQSLGVKWASGSAGRDAGYAYKWNTDTANSDPGSGKLKGNNATISSITTLRVSETDDEGNNTAAILDAWDAGTSTVRGSLHIREVGSPTNWAVFAITAVDTAPSGYVNVTVAYVDGDGSFANNDPVALNFYKTGDAGDDATDAITASTGLTRTADDIAISDAELLALRGLTSAANKIPRFTGSGTADLLDFKDEDNMASDSATAVPSQQSVKAYVDGLIAGSGGISLVTSLPGSPSTGDQVMFTDSLTVPTYRWHLIYNASDSGSYNWQYIGGTPMVAEVATEQSTSSSTYTDLATTGPSITVPLAGDYDVEIGARLTHNGTNNGAWMSYAIGGAGAVDADGIAAYSPLALGAYASLARTKRQTGLSASTALVAKYKEQNASASSAFAGYRFMRVTPVRVG